MTRLSLSIIGATLVFALSTAPTQADMINFRYDWTQSTSFVEAGGAGTGGVNLANPPATSTAIGSGSILAASVTSISDAPRSQPDTFNGQSYEMTVVLTDVASGQSGKLTWEGHLFGSLTSNSASVSSSFDNPLTEQITLGGNLYKVTIGPFIGLNYSDTGSTPLPTSAMTGSLSAMVDVAAYAQTDGGGSKNTPEPSTLILAGLGLSGLFAARRVRRMVAMA